MCSFTVFSFQTDIGIGFKVGVMRDLYTLDVHTRFVLNFHKVSGFRLV